MLMVVTKMMLVMIIMLITTTMEYLRYMASVLGIFTQVIFARHLLWVRYWEYRSKTDKQGSYSHGIYNLMNNKDVK